MIRAKIPRIKMTLKETNALQKDNQTATYSFSWLLDGNSDQAHNLLPTDVTYSATACSYNVSISFYAK
jgi:hypothetical protein